MFRVFLVVEGGLYRPVDCGRNLGRGLWRFRGR